MFSYKYLVLTDLDGTLLNSEGKLSQKTINYVHHLNTRDDILFSFNTGRSWTDVIDIYNTLKLNCWVSCCNGAFLYHPQSNSKHYIFINKKFIIEFLKSPLLLKHLEKAVLLTNSQDINFNSKNSLGALKQLEESNLEVYGIKLYYLDKNTEDSIDEKLNYIKEISEFINISIFRQHGFFNLELQSYLVNKDVAIHDIGNIYGVATKNILTFGDNQNDLSVMLGNSNSYAVKNAILSLKQYAKHISIYTNDNDSVILEIQAFLDKVKI